MAGRRKTDQRRDVSVRLGSGELLNPYDSHNIVAWKRILDVASEELPGFVESLLDDVELVNDELSVARWIARWQLPDGGHAGEIVERIALDTLRQWWACVKAGRPVELRLYVGALRLRPSELNETTWALARPGEVILQEAYAEDVSRLLVDGEELSLLRWNPYQEPRAEASARLHDHLERALDHVERRAGGVRTPEVPVRHLRWLVRWRFGGESIKKLARDAEVSRRAVQIAVDEIAGLLQWGYRHEG